MTFLSDLTYGLAFIPVTTLALVSLLVPMVRLLNRLHRLNLGEALRFVLVVGTATVTLTACVSLAAGAWALLYLQLGAMTDWRSAMIYSLEAITCYGHANLFLNDPWKILGAFEAVNGLLLFGLSTAFLFTVLHKAMPVHFMQQVESAAPRIEP